MQRYDAMINGRFKHRRGLQRTLTGHENFYDASRVFNEQLVQHSEQHRVLGTIEHPAMNETLSGIPHLVGLFCAVGSLACCESLFTALGYYLSCRSVASSLTMPLEASREHLFMRMDTHVQDFVDDELVLRVMAFDDFKPLVDIPELATGIRPVPAVTDTTHKESADNHGTQGNTLLP